MCIIHNPRKIDECMKNLIDYCKYYNMKTLACCCGHDKYPRTLVIKTKQGNIVEVFSDIVLDRKKRFYLKDKEGYYYIPETIKGD